jgi:RNA polymerase sigma-B factor
MASTDIQRNGDERCARRDNSPRRSAGAGRPDERVFVASSSGDDPLLVEVAGRLTRSTAPELVERLSEVCDTDARSVIVDLSTTSAIDKVGVAAVLDQHRRVTGQGRRFSLVCPAGALRGELELAGGIGMPALYGTRARALASSTSYLAPPAPRGTPVSGPPRAHSAGQTRDDDALLRRYAKHRDAATREMLVRRFMPLARHLARRYAGSDESLEDLFQVACLGLIHAIDRYDPNRGPAFASFAVPTIVGEIKHHFRDRTWSMRVPRELQELAMTVDRVSPALATSLGRQPSIAEIADATGHTVERVLEAFEVARAHYATSLDSGAAEGDDLGEGSPSVGDLIGTTEAGYARIDQRLTLRPLLECLTPRERAVLVLRFQHDLTQRQIAERIGVSQMHVSRILCQAITRVRAFANGTTPPRDAPAVGRSTR